MNKKEIRAFFDRFAPSWDEGMVRNEEVIAEILNNAAVKEGIDVLDVASGTGVLIPYYLSRKVASVTAVDISPEMVKIAKAKFNSPQVEIICGDVETISLEKKFDSIVVYNAFPHFPNPEKLIKTLAAYLKKDGILTVAHGMSREHLNMHHKGDAKDVSLQLMPATTLAELFSSFLRVGVVISNAEMYQVTGMFRV